MSIDITTISNDAFNGCENLCSDTGKLELHKSDITSIGDRAFYNCTSILETTLPMSIKSLGDYCFKTNNVNTNIFIPKDLKPPTFSTDESNPFGPVDDTYPKLYVYLSDIEQYKTNPYWSKYKDRFIKYTSDIHFAINLNNAYIDKSYSPTIKVTNVGVVDTSDYIYLYNSAWRCYYRTRISFKQDGDYVKFQVNKSEMEGFLNNRDETKYSTLNISIPMKTKYNQKKFRIIVSIGFGSEVEVEVRPVDVMLSMGTYTESSYSNDWTNRIRTYFNNNATSNSKLYLMGYTINQDENESNKITVPYDYGDGGYQIIPSKLYITENDNGDYFKVSVHLYNSDSSYNWTAITDGGELYHKTVFSLLGCLSQIGNNLDASNFENALELMGMTTSRNSVQINISRVY